MLNSWEHSWELTRMLTKTVLCQRPQLEEWSDGSMWQYSIGWGKTIKGASFAYTGAASDKLKNHIKSYRKERKSILFQQSEKIETHHHSLGDAWEYHILHIQGHVCAQGNLYVGVFQDLSKAGKQLNYCYFSGWENLQLEAWFYSFLASGHSWNKLYHCSLPIQFFAHAGLI